MKVETQVSAWNLKIKIMFTLLEFPMIIVVQQGIAESQKEPWTLLRVADASRVRCHGDHGDTRMMFFYRRILISFRSHMMSLMSVSYNSPSGLRELRPKAATLGVQTKGLSWCFFIGEGVENWCKIWKSVDLLSGIVLRKEIQGDVMRWQYNWWFR